MTLIRNMSEDAFVGAVTGLILLIANLVYDAKKSR